MRSVCGVEPLVLLTDVGGLSREEAVDLMRWSPKALFQAALAENLKATKYKAGSTTLAHTRRRKPVNES